MNALALYVRYALRSFVRGRTRSVFGAFCVAVGVASVVALGLVGGNFQDKVTGDARQQNRGDVSVWAPSRYFDAKDYRYFASLKTQGKVDDYTSLLNLDALLKTPSGDQNDVNIGSLYAVEPQKFPFYDTIKADQPAGVPLAQLLTHPNDAVVGHDTYDTLHLRIGQKIKVAYRFGGTGIYTVRGVVPDSAPDSGFGSGLFSQFAIVDRSSVTSYMKANGVTASAFFLKTRDAGAASAVKQDIERHFGSLINPKTVADVQKDSANSADGFNKFFRIMGLVAVVIGGIGIINTMLVAARRRMREIAVLKSIGMKGRQVVLVFTIESLILGVAGTAVGILLGIFASFAVNNVTRGMAGYDIPWSIHPRPIVAGALVGIVATVLFAYLPVLRASRARPVASLRDGDETSVKAGWFRPFLHAMRTRPFATVGNGLRRLPMGIVRLPKRQGFRTFFLVLALAALMGYLAVLYAGLTSGVQTVIVGAIAGIGTLVAAGVLIQIFVILIWLISKLPSMGSLSIRMAFRNMGTQKRRLGSTLLALCIGILSIGSIAIMAQNLKHEVGSMLEQRQNFSVSVQSPHTPAVQRHLNAVVAGLPGVERRVDGAIANQLTLAAVDGRPVTTLARRALAGWTDKDGKHKYGKDQVTQAISNMRALAGTDLHAARNQYIMVKGRNLEARDAGTDHLVVSQDFAEPFNIKLGSRVVYAEPGLRVPFTVVGIASSNNFMVMAESAADLRYMQRVGLTAPSGSHNSVTLLKIRHADLKGDVAKLRQALPQSLVLDLSNFLQFLKAIDKLALFPEIIGGLALFAGVIIIANTVALAMLERRREIGVMKAVGARRRTILRFLFVENAVVGFLGAGAGVLLSMAAAAIVDEMMLKITPSFDWLTIVGLVVLGMILAIGASALTALPASSEKPLRVLRYE